MTYGNLACGKTGEKGIVEREREERIRIAMNTSAEG